MADYFTHFSCLLDVGTPENAVRALDLYSTTPEDEDGLRLSDGFGLSIQSEGGTELWIHDDCSGDPERVIEFVLLCAEHGMRGIDRVPGPARPEALPTRFVGLGRDGVEPGHPLAAARAADREPHRDP